MCIALISTAHPAYSLIVIDNRDVGLNIRVLCAELTTSRNSCDDLPHCPTGGQNLAHMSLVHAI